MKNKEKYVVFTIYNGEKGYLLNDKIELTSQSINAQRYTKKQAIIRKNLIERFLNADETTILSINKASRIDSKEKKYIYQ